MCVSFLCCTFSFWGWIRQGKNDWTLNRVQNVVLLHYPGKRQDNFGPVHSLYFAIFSKMDFENNFPAPAKPIIAVGFNCSTHSSKLLIFLWSWANLICIGSKSNLSEVINPSTKSSGYSELSRDLEGSKSSSYRHRAKFSCKHLLDSHPCRGVRGQGDWQHPNQLHQHPRIRTFDRQYVFQSHAELRSDQILHMRRYLKQIRLNMV